MNGRTVALAAVAVAFVAGLAALGTWRLASAGGADVTEDGRVRIDDAESARLQRTPTNTPTPMPTSTPAPMIVGNRALITVGNFAGVLLVNTSDGSVVSTVTGPGPSGTTVVLGTSCDGMLGAVSEAVTASTHHVQILNTLTGAVLVTVNLGLPFQQVPGGAPYYERILFPCPLKGSGGTFNSGAPQTGRAVLVTLNEPTNSCCRVTLYDLGAAQDIFSDTTTGGVWLNCANDTLMYGIASNEATNLVRLADGALVGSVAGYPNVLPTC